MTWVFIEPMDVWLFRDGKPFSAGEGHMARSIFPPTPLTVQGALRNLFLARSNVNWRAYRRQLDAEGVAEVSARIGQPSPGEGDAWAASLGEFGMAGPYLARREDDRIVQYTPLPSDIVRVKGHRDKYVALKPAKQQAARFAWPDNELYPLWPPDVKDIEEPDGNEWVDAINLGYYLEGDNVSVLTDADLFGPEPRFGIAIDPVTGAVRESMLYQAEFMRPEQDVGLLVKLTGSLSMPAKQGVMGLGGESRGAYYTVLEDKDVEAPTSALPSTRLKIVLQTPAFFAKGWQPANGWSTFFGNQAVRLVAVSMSQPQRLGGWDLALRAPKAIRPYVPAGSVYYFESDLPITPPTGPFSEAPIEEAHLVDVGFGQFVTGVWDWHSQS